MKFACTHTTCLLTFARSHVWVLTGPLWWHIVFFEEDTLSFLPKAGEFSSLMSRPSLLINHYSIGSDCVLFPRTQYPQKINSVLEADFHQKLLMKFTLKDKSSGDTFTAHQTFVKLTNLDTKQEIIFVAEADSSNNYKFDLVCKILSVSETLKPLQCMLIFIFGLKLLCCFSQALQLLYKLTAW